MSKRTEHWLALSPAEASSELFALILDFFIKEEGWKITACPNVRLLTQRLYGDYRLVHMTNEYKRAEKHYRWWKNSPMGKALL